MMVPLQPVHERSATRVIDCAGFRFTEARYSPGYRIARHRHGAPGLTFVLSGAMEESVGGRKRDVAARTILHKPADETHQNRFGMDGAHCLIAEPRPERADQLDAASPLLRRIGQLHGAAVRLLVSRLERELRYPDDALPLLLESLTLEAIAFGLRRRPPRTTPSWLKVAMEFLDARYLEPLRMDDVAVAAGVHPVHLARVFRVHAGIGPADYVRRRRVDYAAAELCGSHDSIAAIALKAGFSDQSHLTRAFRQQLGVTPAAYRSAHTT